MAVKICQASELTHQHLKTFSESSSAPPAVSEGAPIGAVSFQSGSRHRRARTAQLTEDAMFSCKRCGTRHKPRQCPAFGKVCSNCHGKNHFAKQCFTRKKEGKKGKNVNVVDNTDLCDTFFVGLVSSENEGEKGNTVVNNDKWITPLLINGTVVTVR